MLINKQSADMTMFVEKIRLIKLKAIWNMHIEEYINNTAKKFLKAKQIVFPAAKKGFKRTLIFFSCKSAGK